MAAASLNYGETISKDWLIANFMLEKPKFGTPKDFEKFAFLYLSNVENFKAYMLERHFMHLVCQRGEGYLIVHPADQADLAFKTMQKNVRAELTKAVDVLTYVNTKLLNDDELRNRDSKIGKIAALAAFSKNQKIIGSTTNLKENPIA